MSLDPRLNAFRPDLADLRLSGKVAAGRFVAGEPYRVSAAHAPVRRAPADDAMLLTEGLFGEAVLVFEETADGWAWGQLVTDRYVGWIPLACLARDMTKPTHQVSALRTFAFSRPDIKSPPRLGLPFGSQVCAVGKAEDKNASYALIAPAGAVVAQHLQPVGAAEADWTEVAERFIGAPYLWGGKTGLGIDCSGLVQVALAACGIAALRDSDMQEAELGNELPLAGGMPPLRRGDLIFWKGHVGLMRDSETLLHANAHYMAVASEPLTEAVSRLRAKGTEVTSVRRIGRE